MKLEPPLSSYLTGAKPTHSSRPKLGQHIKLFKQNEIEAHLKKGKYLNDAGKPTKKALEDGLIDQCDGKVIWNLKNTKKALLALTKKDSARKVAAPKLASPPPRPKQAGPVWTDLENIGTYFGVGKNKIGKWLDELGLRDYKPRQVNESGDYDMLDIANESKEKFRVKIPTEKALAEGYARVETITYTQKGKEKSFDKYTWDRDRVKDLLVRAGHELDTERKLHLKGKGRNSDVKVESIDDRAKKLHAEWKKLHSNPKTRDQSWKLFDKQPSGLLMRVEQLMGRPRYLRDKLYLKK